MADTQAYYDSTLTGPELDAALKKLPQVDAAVEQAGQNARLAQSWAEGGTGLREEENLNNARYWCNQAQTITQGAMGWYADEEELKVVCPVGQNGQWAIIGSTDTIWTWDSDTDTWVDSGAQIDLSNYYTGPQADARFQMPVGYIFDWAPVEGQTMDLSTPEKVAEHFGYGTWKELNGVFTFARKDGYEVGGTGGEEKHTLTVAEMPNHDHPYASYTAGYWGYGAQQTNMAAGSGVWAQHVQTVAPQGGGQPHNNMPPYLTVYKWQRIA